MNKFFKRFSTAIVAMATCLSVGIHSFAAKPTTTDNIVNDNIAITENNDIMPRGTLSGYAYAVISPEKNYIIIPCQSSVYEGEVSGMGITIQTTCSDGNYVVGFRGYAEDGKATTVQGSMTTNDEVYLAGSHTGCKEYVIYFSNIPSGCPPFEVRVWIYG